MIKKKKSKNERINKSKEIIKKEKVKIKEEKRKIRQERQKKFYNTPIGNILKKIFFISETEKESTSSIGKQIFYMIYFELIGAIICILVFFILSGGKNFIKLYIELSKLIDVYDVITDDYYGDLDKEKLVDDAIESMLSGTGDSYTTYSDENNTKNFLENVNGTYEGIGCTVTTNENGNIVVVSLFENGPAHKAGIQENDIILKIDGHDYKGKTSQDMATYVKNSAKPKITLTINRNGEEKEITINRQSVEVPSVSSEVLEQDGKKIGYIDISIFSAVTYEQFKSQLKKLETQNIEGLIIDVRNDTGGYLSAVTDITSLFLTKGKIIYQLEDNNKTEKIKDETKESRKYPVAVLVNSYSASASEILAAAIKESYGGFVVGTTTYGKGTVQKTKQLSDGTMIKYTIQKWLTPNGNWIHEKGVAPTNKVELLIDNKTDNQLQTALELIAEKCN